MNTKPELPESDVLRKSLDAVDRGRVWMRVVNIVILLGALFFGLAVTSLAESEGARNLRLEIMAGFIATISCVFGVAISVLRASNANTRRILKAIELLSEGKSERPLPGSD